MGKTYLDDKGNKIFVRQGLGEVFKAFRRTGRQEHGVPSQKLPYRKSAEEAQNDLDAYAKAKGWKECQA